MKKTFALMVAVFAFAMVFNSCEKEGQYKPSKKISKIVYTRSHKTGELVVSTTQGEKWAWGGDLLSHIDYFNSDGDRTGTLWFRYDDDNRLEEAEDGLYTVKYDYDDGHLDEVEIRYIASGRLYQKMKFDYKGSKLTSVDITTYDKKGEESLAFNPLRFILSDEVAEAVMSAPATKGVEHLTVSWSGKNITEITSGDYYAKWTYDDKINPFKGFYNMEYSIDQTHSANNPVREEISKDGKVTVVEYNYDYDGKYPIRVKYQTESSTLIPGITLTVDNVKEYQY
jgi:hypothetical protein